MFDPTKCESVSMAQAKAQEEQNPVNAALRATSIAFVTLAESGQIDDTTATENVAQFSPWVYPATCSDRKKIQARNYPSYARSNFKKCNSCS